MDFIKKVFPTAYMVNKKDLPSLIIQLAIFTFISFLVTVNMVLMFSIPGLNILSIILGISVLIYNSVGTFISIANYIDLKIG